MEDLKVNLDFWNNALILLEHLKKEDILLKELIKITLEDSLLANKKIEKILSNSLKKRNEDMLINYLFEEKVINHTITNILRNDEIKIHSKIQNIIEILHKKIEDEEIENILNYLNIKQTELIYILFNISIIENEKEFYEKVLEHNIYTEEQLKIYKKNQSFQKIKDTLINKRNYEFKKYKNEYKIKYTPVIEKKETLINKIKSFFN
jgi:dTDP-D-glucose 4,6-dehydratase